MTSREGKQNPVADKPIHWAFIIFFSAALPRCVSAFLLPNAFGDAYAYIRQVEFLAAKIQTGIFTINDLYGFWLPLYQLICALCTLVFGHPFAVSRLVSVVFGALLCIIVYKTSLVLTDSRTLSLAATALIAFDPLHIFNSASAMTDIPNAFFVIASLYFIIQRRWLWAAVLGALSGCVRVDSWILIFAIPTLEFIRERKVSLSAVVILLVPPVLWFFISWRATGDWLACFVMRRNYMSALFAANPDLASFSGHGILRDLGAFVMSADVVVIAAVVFALVGLARLVVADGFRKTMESQWAIVSVAAIYSTFFSFLVLAYLTHAQPIIFPRYGLLLFAIGLPLLPWAWKQIQTAGPRFTRKIKYVAFALIFIKILTQVVYSVGYINRTYPAEMVAMFLYAQAKADPNIRILNDDGTVLALSNLADNQFVSSSNVPSDAAGFCDFIRLEKLTYVVVSNESASTAQRLFPELGSGMGNKFLTPVLHTQSKFLRSEVWVYKVNQ